MENPELLLLEIEEFNRASDSQDDKLPQNLENFVEYVSKTGTYIFPWNLVKKIFQKKLSNVIENLQSCMSLSTSDMNTSSSTSFQCNEQSNIQTMKERIVERMKSFNNAPFTIQRICELLLKPTNHYNRIDKYLRSLEKCIMVVTTIDPSGNKIFMDNFLTNGAVTNQTVPLMTPKRPMTPPENHIETINESFIPASPVKELESSTVSSEPTESASTDQEAAVDQIEEPTIDDESKLMEIQKDESIPIDVDISEASVKSDELEKPSDELEKPSEETKNAEVTESKQPEETTTTIIAVAETTNDISETTTEITVNKTELAVAENEALVESSTDMIISTTSEQVEGELHTEATSTTIESDAAILPSTNSE